MMEESDGNDYWVMKACDTLARSKGMSSIFFPTDRERKKRNLDFGTYVKAFNALGLQLRVVAKPG